jgi:hypothetical protein
VKRFYIGGLLFLQFLFSLHPQAASSMPMDRADIIVLLDNSGTMFPFFDTINTAVLEDITANFIRQGDTFHLITFNTTAATEIVQQVSSETDIRRIVSRFRLLYPLGIYSDFLSAIKFTQRYVNSLTAGSQKIVIIISDGLLHPPETSPYYQFSPQEAETEISSSVSRMFRDGIQIYYIKAPFPNGVRISSLSGKGAESREQGAGDGKVVSDKETDRVVSEEAPAVPVKGETVQDVPAKESALDSEPVQAEDVAESESDFFEYATTLEESSSVVTDTLPKADPDVGEVSSFTETTMHLPEITFKEALGGQFYKFKIPLVITNNGDSRLRLQLDKLIINSENVLERTLFIDVPPRGTKSFKPTVVLPDSWEQGEQSLSAQLIFADNVRVQPQWFSFSVTLKPGVSFGQWFQQYRFAFFAILMIAGAILLIVIIVVLLNRLLSGSHAHAIRTVQESDTASPAVVDALKDKASSSGALDTAKTQNGEGKDSARSLLGAFGRDKAVSDGVLDTAKAQDGEGKDSTRSLLGAFGKDRTATGSVLETAKTQDGEGKDSTRSLLSAFGKDRTATGGVLDMMKAHNGEGKDSARSLLGAFSKDKGSSGGVLDTAKAQDGERKDSARSLLSAFSPDNGEWKLPAASKPVSQKKSRNRVSIASPGKVEVKGQHSIMLELFVDRQNRNIGKRNIHMLKPGSRMTVGGTGRSAFMVFLVKFPGSLAEIRYDGVTCSLAILKPEYFPYETETVLPDCLNRDIILRSDKGYEVTFRLKNYENPAVRLNQLMLSLGE